MSLTGWDVFAVTALTLVGNGFLGKVLLHFHQVASERKLAEHTKALEGDIRKLQLALDRSLTVHRVQFEAEFRAVQTIWAAVMDLRGTMASVRPIADIAPLDQTKDQAEERLRIRFKAFSEALGVAKDAIYQNEIFIPEAIFKELEKALAAAQAEHISLRLHRKDETSDWYERGEKNLTDLMISINSVAKMIKARLQHLTVLPE